MINSCGLVFLSWSLGVASGSLWVVSGIRLKITDAVLTSLWCLMLAWPHAGKDGRPVEFQEKDIWVEVCLRSLLCRSFKYSLSLPLVLSSPFRVVKEHCVTNSERDSTLNDGSDVTEWQNLCSKREESVFHHRAGHWMAGRENRD